MRERETGREKERDRDGDGDKEKGRESKKNREKCQGLFLSFGQEGASHPPDVQTGGLSKLQGGTGTPCTAPPLKPPLRNVEKERERLR